jgi:hypothetical protein
MDHGGCRISTRRESTRTAFGLLQHEQKNSGIAEVNVYSDTAQHDATQSRDQNRIVDATHSIVVANFREICRN